jgi:FkbM family methyltransferase
MISRLQANRELNHLEVEIVGLALSNRSGFQTFHLGPPGNPGMSTLSPWSAATYHGICVVATARGDDLVSGGLVPPPTVIKIDVEGHELPALEGLTNTLRRPSLNAVIFEDSGDAKTPVKMLLEDAGFTCERLNRLEHSHHGLENFVARRKASTN